MARPEGFEPPAFRIGICCDIQLRHGRICFRCIWYYSTQREKMQGGASVFFGVSLSESASPCRVSFTVCRIYMRLYKIKAFVLRSGRRFSRVCAPVCGQTEEAGESRARNPRPSCAPKWPVHAGLNFTICKSFTGLYRKRGFIPLAERRLYRGGVHICGQTK